MTVCQLLDQALKEIVDDANVGQAQELAQMEEQIGNAPEIRKAFKSILNDSVQSNQKLFTDESIIKSSYIIHFWWIKFRDIHHHDSNQEFCIRI